MRKFIYFLVLSILFINSVSAQNTVNPAKNLIIISADGLSLSNKTITRIFKTGPYGSMNIDNMETFGFMTNHSADNWISDSAANSTAISTKFKTENGKVGVLPNGKIKTNFFERLSLIKKKKGIVTNGPITSPALSPYYAHVDSYKDEAKMVEQLFRKDVNVILGAGERAFLPQSEEGIRTDEKNYIEEAQRLGYKFISEKMSLNDFSYSEKVLGLFGNDHMPFEIDRDKKLPSLAEMTKKALELLKSENGFVLLVENYNLARALNNLDVNASVEEVHEIDNVIGVIKEFQKTEKDTLFLVVSGYDCGGFVLGEEFNPILFSTLKSSTESLSKKITTTGSNIEEIFAVYAGINLKSEERDYVSAGMNTNYFIPNISKIIANRGGVETLPSNYISKRTATVSPVWASGINSFMFAGFNDNTQIGELIEKVIGIKY